MEQRRVLRLVLVLVLTLCVYVALLVVRTLQALPQFGKFAQFDPVTAALMQLPVRRTPDGLRWASYALFVLLVLGYFAVLRLLRTLPPRAGSPLRRAYLAWVVVPYCVLGLTVLFLYPHVSRPMDTVDYTVHARLFFAHQANPYAVPGSSYTDREPLVSFMEASQRPSVYGPVWEYLSVVPGLVGAGQLLTSIVAFKNSFLCCWSSVPVDDMGFSWKDGWCHRNPDIDSWSDGCVEPSASSDIPRRGTQRYCDGGLCRCRARRFGHRQDRLCLRRVVSFSPHEVHHSNSCPPCHRLLARASSCSVVQSRATQPVSAAGDWSRRQHCAGGALGVALRGTCASWNRSRPILSAVNVRRQLQDFGSLSFGGALTSFCRAPYRLRGSCSRHRGGIAA